MKNKNQAVQTAPVVANKRSNLLIAIPVIWLALFGYFLVTKNNSPFLIGNAIISVFVASWPQKLMTNRINEATKNSKKLLGEQAYQTGKEVSVLFATIFLLIFTFFVTTLPGYLIGF